MTITIDAKLDRSLAKLESAGLLSHEHAVRVRAFITTRELPPGDTDAGHAAVSEALATLGAVAALYGFKT